MKKHILVVGDSNTHGYCANPEDTESHSNRFTENERYPQLLQKALGDDYLVIEEGLGGRTTVFQDPLHESMDCLSVIYSICMSHEPLDLVVVMLGTNDTKDRFGANARCIALGMDRLVRKIMTIDCFGGKAPNVLVVCPPPMSEEMQDPGMGFTCHEKSVQLAAEYRIITDQIPGCSFMDAAGCEFNSIDHMHLSGKGHSQLAKRLTEIIPGLLV